uniref:Uncharacterized protein n=1 Tax=Arundo donax TaxID=35708 RepID=A0A0A9HJ52_ARUDO
MGASPHRRRNARFCQPCNFTYRDTPVLHPHSLRNKQEKVQAYYSKFHNHTTCMINFLRWDGPVSYFWDGNGLVSCLDEGMGSSLVFCLVGCTQVVG